MPREMALMLARLKARAGEGMSARVDDAAIASSFFFNGQTAG